MASLPVKQKQQRTARSIMITATDCQSVAQYGIETMKWPQPVISGGRNSEYKTKKIVVALKGNSITKAKPRRPSGINEPVVRAS